LTKMKSQLKNVHLAITLLPLNLLILIPFNFG
jgi:hypothetical protein